MWKLIWSLVFGGMVVLIVGCNNNDDTLVENGNGNNYNQDPGQSIALDSVDGLLEEGRIKTGQEITFFIRVANSTGKSILGITNGFRVYSPDGARWNTTTGDTTGTIGKALFDGGFFIIPVGVTGSGADTIGYGGFAFSQGIPDGFDAVSFGITIGPINSSYTGLRICLDSSFYPPSNSWLWAGNDDFSFKPGWSGPHCYVVGN